MLTLQVFETMARINGRSSSCEDDAESMHRALYFAPEDGELDFGAEKNRIERQRTFETWLLDNY